MPFVRRIGERSVAAARPPRRSRARRVALPWRGPWPRGGRGMGRGRPDPGVQVRDAARPMVRPGGPEPASPAPAVFALLWARSGGSAGSPARNRLERARPPGGDRGAAMPGRAGHGVDRRVRYPRGGGSSPAHRPMGRRTLMVRPGGQGQTAISLCNAGTPVMVFVRASPAHGPSVGSGWRAFGPTGCLTGGACGARCTGDRGGTGFRDAAVRQLVRVRPGAPVIAAAHARRPRRRPRGPVIGGIAVGCR